MIFLSKRMITLISTKSSSTREERAANAALAAIEGQRFYTWEKSDRKHASMKEKVKIWFFVWNETARILFLNMLKTSGLNITHGLILSLEVTIWNIFLLFAVCHFKAKQGFFIGRLIVFLGCNHSKLRFPRFEI